MLMGNFLKDRKSVREFKKKRIDKKTMDSVVSIFYKLEEEADNKYFNFILLEDGVRVNNLLKGTAGYSGVMIESPHYIGIRLKEVSDVSIITASYFTEKLMTELTRLNLGSCWVNVKSVDKGIKSHAFGKENKNIGYIVAFGYPKARNPFVQEPTSSRHSVQDIVYYEELGKEVAMEELENRGLDDLFYYVRFAPSNYNIQPWRFVLKKDRVVVYLEYSDEGKTDLMDAGIIMYYFEELAKTIGISKKWNIIETPEIEYGGSKYRPVGEFEL